MSGKKCPSEYRSSQKRQSNTTGEGKNLNIIFLDYVCSLGLSPDRTLDFFVM